MVSLFTILDSHHKLQVTPTLLVLWKVNTIKNLFVSCIVSLNFLNQKHRDIQKSYKYVQNFIIKNIKQNCHILYLIFFYPVCNPFYVRSTIIEWLKVGTDFFRKWDFISLVLPVAISTATTSSSWSQRLLPSAATRNSPRQRCLSCKCFKVHI